MSYSNENMYTLPLIDVAENCRKCEHICNYFSGNIELGDIRVKCTRCRTGINGIYKADAIINLLNPNSSIPNRHEGKKSIIPESVKKTMISHYQSGLTLRKIAEITGYSKNQVHRIVRTKL